MRGEVCIGLASILALASTLLLIFAHVGQINTSNVPKGIYMTKVNVSGYGDSLEVAILNPIFGLYTDNASAPLGDSAGLRQYYQFGLYSYCAYVNDSAGSCSNHTAGFRFTPFDTLVSDMRSNFSTLTQELLPGDLILRDSHYLGQTSRAAYFLILLATIGAALTFILGILKYSITFFLSALAAGISSLFLVVAAALWTVMINRSNDINTRIIGSAMNTTPLGIEVSTGTGFYLIWAAFACLFLSMIPYIISCCTYRG
ncbi:hypothetical protein D9758_000024 [Tetrapyrgos nigripes]|uniref:Uncharacterized protein n=1 Tax=Tetrapyrgos nigripes TaxID=182062 RepID=A0A8H5H1U6_9AGAR|nr:hypothetical protein D9758_000024 [Tetrapyrgos nigripes]